MKQHATNIVPITIIANEKKMKPGLQAIRLNIQAKEQRTCIIWPNAIPDDGARNSQDRAVAPEVDYLRMMAVVPRL